MGRTRHEISCTASEKAEEIIELVSSSRICRPSARWTSSAFPAPPSTDGTIAIGREGLRALADHRSRPRIASGIAFRTTSASRSSTWRCKSPELSPRELAVCASLTKESTSSPRHQVYRLLKAHDLITSPAYVVIKAANEFKDKTTAINQLWQPNRLHLPQDHRLGLVLSVDSAR